MLQPMYYFPFSIDFIKHSKKRLAIGVCGKMIRDIFTIRFFKRDNIVFDLHFSQRGFILFGFNRYYFWIHKYKKVM
jgi:hypothetical protein